VFRFLFLYERKEGAGALRFSPSPTPLRLLAQRLACFSLLLVFWLRFVLSRPLSSVRRPLLPLTPSRALSLVLYLRLEVCAAHLSFYRALSLFSLALTLSHSMPLSISFWRARRTRSASLSLSLSLFSPPHLFSLSLSRRCANSRSLRASSARWCCKAVQRR